MYCVWTISAKSTYLSLTNSTATIHLMRTFKITLTRRNFTPNSKMYTMNEIMIIIYETRTTRQHQHTHALTNNGPQTNEYDNFIMRYNNTAALYSQQWTHGANIFRYQNIYNDISSEQHNRLSGKNYTSSNRELKYERKKNISLENRWIVCVHEQN